MNIEACILCGSTKIKYAGVFVPNAEFDRQIAALNPMVPNAGDGKSYYCYALCKKCMKIEKQWRLQKIEERFLETSRRMFAQMSAARN